MKAPLLAMGGGPGAPADDAPDMDASEDCIPLSALAMPDADNGDQMANPAVGDKVNYQVDGTVTRIEGENAYVKRENINGQPVTEEAGEDEGATGEDQADQGERDELGSMAGQGEMS